MKYFLTMLALVSLIAGISSACSAEMDTKMQYMVCYYPFASRTWTFVPITQRILQEHCSEFSINATQDLLAAISRYKTSRGGQEPFSIDENALRLIIQKNNKTIAVLDRDGNLLFRGGNYKIMSSNMTELNAVVQKLFDTKNGHK